MGLAEIKFRRKIDKDPNNTTWAKDTSSFGQKILRSQGWEPGQYLGAKDAAQAEHYTAANASFVRVSLKDDMLGLGFKQAKEERSTGMDAFQNMLARLNGKSEVDIQKEQQAKQAIASSLYCDSKFGPMRFVRGGFLVGDKEQATTENEKKEEDDDDDKDVKIEDAPEVALKDVSKKRKADEVSSDSDSSSSSEDEKAKKKRRKEERKAAKKQKSDSAKTSPHDTQDDTEAGSSRSKKSRKDKAKLGETDSSAAEDKDARKRRRKEKKEERKARKEKKAADDSDSDDDKAARKEKKRRKKELKKAEEAAKASASRSASGTATPASGTSTPVLRGHHAVRSRWIASKRMATMDDTALNQIFGIKASS